MTRTESPDPRVPFQRADETPAQDDVSSFTVWSNTTMLGEDDADQAGNDAVLRGID
jgi:hypothetical protein